MYLSYFMQISRLGRYVSTLWNYVFMGTEFGKGGPILAAKIGPGGPFLTADRFFRYRALSLVSYGRWECMHNSFLPQTRIFTPEEAAEIVLIIVLYTELRILILICVYCY